MTVEAVLFDLDGTLVDSLEDLTDAVNHMRAAFDKPPLSSAEVRQLVGKGSRNLVERALETVDEIIVERGLELFLSFNSTHIADKSVLYPGATALLERLSSKGIPLAVVSNKNEGLSRLILSALNIDHFFTAVSGGDTYPERKPSPLPLQRMADQLGITPQGAVMVGDSINDIQAGKLAGMATIGCRWGYGAAEELQGADHQAGSFHEVSTLLLGGTCGL